jgi:hypothetical protein
VLGAITVALIAVVGWAGPRWTKEGRLLMRIRRLGDAYALLPESSERDQLGTVITELAHELNAWNGPDQRTARRWRIGSSIGTLVIAYGVMIGFWSATSVEPSVLWIWSLIVGTMAGALAVAVTEIAERVITRRAARAAREARMAPSVKESH